MPRVSIITVLILAAVVTTLPGQEHPGINISNTTPAQKVQVTILDYIKQDQTLKGQFMIYDEKTGLVRQQLKFDKFHTVNQINRDQYFTCTDFIDHNNDRLDVDFYINRIDEEQWEVAKIKLHKVNGIKQ